MRQPNPAAAPSPRPATGRATFYRAAAMRWKAN